MVGGDLGVAWPDGAIAFAPAPPVCRMRCLALFCTFLGLFTLTLGRERLLRPLGPANRSIVLWPAPRDLPRRPPRAARTGDPHLPAGRECCRPLRGADGALSDHPSARTRMRSFRVEILASRRR